MKQILVTGATGFIGNYVIKQLLQENFSVIATSANREKAEMTDWYPLVKYIPFDIKQFDNNINYHSFFENPGAVIHLAWEGLPNYKAAFHVEENLPRHYFFLKNLIENGLTDLTVTGTCLEYGMQEGCLSEDMPAMPANSYAEAKNNLQERLQHLQSNKGFTLKWVRLFYMYGKGQNSKSLFSQLDEAIKNGDNVFNMSGGEQVRDYLTVEKMAEYIVKIAMQSKFTGTINCCSGNPVSVKKLVENYLAEKHKTISLNLGYYPYSDYEPMKFWGDTKKLKQSIEL